jgi:HSP20 family protein
MTTGTALAPARSLRNLLTTDPFLLFQNRLNRLFEEPYGALMPTAMGEEFLPLTTWTPACDIYETDKDIVIKAELPEVEKKDVFVSLENNVLTIRGERKFNEETKRENYHRVERRYGEFIRSFTLPAFIDPAKINAEFKDGLLNIVLPKREEAKPKQIEVKVK